MSELLPRADLDRLIKVAKRRAAKHWPSAAGVCPVCKVKNCEPMQTAQTFLQTYSKPPEPIIKS